MMDAHFSLLENFMYFSISEHITFIIRRDRITKNYNKYNYFEFEGGVVKGGGRREKERGRERGRRECMQTHASDEVKTSTMCVLRARSSAAVFSVVDGRCLSFWVRK